MRDVQVYAIIGQRIRRRRRLMGLTQTALGERCGFSFQRIQKYETGTVAMPAATLLVFARALEVAPAYFLPEVLPEVLPACELDFDRTPASPTRIDA